MRFVVVPLICISLCVPGCASKRSYQYDRCMETSIKTKSVEQAAKECERIRDDSSSGPSRGVDSILNWIGLAAMIVIVCNKATCGKNN
jgi:hypothetical protein